MNPWDLLSWAFVIGLSAFVASWGIAFAVALIAGAANIHRSYTPATATKEDIL